MLKPPKLNDPERILVFGNAGTGKSTGWLNIAKWAERTKSSAHFHVIDSDFAIPRMLGNYSTLVNRVHVYPCYEWNDYVSAAKTIAKVATTTDWLCIDFIGSAWQAVTDFYIQEIFHKTSADYFLQVRKSLDTGAKTLGALQGWVDYPVINNLYRKWVIPTFFRGPYHIYSTAKSTQLSSDRSPSEDSQTRQMLLRYNVKPDGQKTLLFQHHSVLLTGLDPRTDKRTITTVKDREREEVNGLVVTNFAMDYLKKIGGWVL